MPVTLAVIPGNGPPPGPAPAKGGKVAKDVTECVGEHPLILWVGNLATTTGGVDLLSLVVFLTGVAGACGSLIELFVVTRNRQRVLETVRRTFAWDPPKLAAIGSRTDAAAANDAAAWLVTSERLSESLAQHLLMADPASCRPKAMIGVADRRPPHAAVNSRLVIDAPPMGASYSPSFSSYSFGGVEMNPTPPGAELAFRAAPPPTLVPLRHYDDRVQRHLTTNESKVLGIYNDVISHLRHLSIEFSSDNGCVLPPLSEEQWRERDLIIAVRLLARLLVHRETDPLPAADARSAESLYQEYGASIPRHVDDVPRAPRPFDTQQAADRLSVSFPTARALLGRLKGVGVLDSFQQASRHGRQAQHYEFPAGRSPPFGSGNPYADLLGGLGSDS